MPQKILFPIVALLFLFFQCAHKEGNEGRTNPLDPGGANYHPPVVVAMADTTVAIYDMVPLHAKGSDSNGYVVKYLWAKDARNYRDTTSDSLLQTRFSRAGNDTVLVKAMDNDGVVSATPDTVIVHVHLYAPIVSLLPSDTILSIGDSIRLTASARDTNGAIVAFYWAMNGSDFSSTPGDSVVKTTFLSQGLRLILVKAVDDDSLQVVDTARIYVYDNAPLLYSPLNNAVLQYQSTTLQWHPGYYAHHFQVILDTVSPPITIVTGATRDSVYSASNLAFDKKYYWKVVGFNGLGASDTSETWCFTTGKTGLVSTSGLVAYYPFNGNANDESGNGNNATVNGATLTSDRFGSASSAYNFNGASYITIPYAPTLNINAGEFTLAAWIKTADSSAGILSQSQYQYEEGHYNLSLYDSFGTLRVRENNGTYDYNARSAQPVNDWNWHSLVGQRRNSVPRGNDTLLFYLDGIKQQAVYVAALDSLSSYDQLYIGCLKHYAALDDYYWGLIDDIRIYNRALTDQEIQALYHESGW